MVIGKVEILSHGKLNLAFHRRKIMDTKITNILNHNALFHRNFRQVAVLSASLVIHECNRWSPNGNMDYLPQNSESVLRKLLEHHNLHWDVHSCINAIQNHVEIIYAYVEAILDFKNHNLYINMPDINEAILIAKSLNIYQDWKTVICKNEEEVNGEGWGSAMGFYTAKWNKNNKEFLDLYKEKIEVK